jgi:hypothetical protein
VDKEGCTIGRNYSLSIAETRVRSGEERQTWAEGKEQRAEIGLLYGVCGR